MIATGCAILLDHFAAQTKGIRVTIPTANPTAQDVTIGAAAFAAEDAEGLAYVMQTHATRRDELLAAVDAATTPEAVQAIAVSYAV